MITIRGSDTMNCFFNALFLFINNPEVRDINYQIALGLLENGHELDYLTINELADRCFVSTSSLNRFFRIYGYGVQSYNYYWKKQIYYARMLLFVFSMHIPFLLSYIGTAIVVGVVGDAPLGIY